MSKANWQRILVATDLSPSANAAVTYAHTLAEKFGAEFHVLHVARNPTDAAGMFGATGTFEPGDAADASNDWLRTILGESGSIRRVESIQVGHDVVGKIVQYAAAQSIDLIVLATHGRSGVARLWLGSITEEVIHSVQCPVLVLRSGQEEAQTAQAPTEHVADCLVAMKK